MAKCKKFNEGSMVSDDFQKDKSKDFESNPYSKPKAKKPLPADNLKQDKPVVEKYVVEPFRKANDKVSNYLESKGLTNPIDVVDETLGGETIAEARARREGRPTAKGSSYKSGGKVSSASKRADGCATKGKTRGRMV